jgi:hypothetical protein
MLYNQKEKMNSNQKNERIVWKYNNNTIDILLLQLK